MAKDIHVITSTKSMLDLVQRTEDLMRRQASEPRQRILIALAGVPGSGKSTVSRSLVTELAARGIQDVAILPMDGFHYTRAELSTFDNSDLAFRMRGAPFTFDASAFVKLVVKLKMTPVTSQPKHEDIILAPGFDHAAKDPVPDAIAISTNTRLILVEGNYTLLDQHPWNKIPQYCNERWFIEAPIDDIRSRIAKRHVTAGIEDTMEAAVHRVNENDVPNGNMIRAKLIKPDVVIHN